METHSGIPSNKYSKEYLEAVDFFELSLFDECIQAAKVNLANPTLPRYHQLKNLILIISALDDWQEAHEYLRQAKDIYAEADRLALSTEVKATSNLRKIR